MSKVGKIISQRKDRRLLSFLRSPPIASGTTLIGSVDRIPDEKKINFYAGYEDMRKERSKYF
jgi:hypothetical protein